MSNNADHPQSRRDVATDLADALLDLFWHYADKDVAQTWKPQVHVLPDGGVDVVLPLDGTYTSVEGARSVLPLWVADCNRVMELLNAYRNGIEPTTMSGQQTLF